MLSKRQARQRLADLVTFAAMDGATEQGRHRFQSQLDGLSQDITALCAGRFPKALTGADAVKFMALYTEFNQLAIEQKHFTEAVLHFSCQKRR